MKYPLEIEKQIEEITEIVNNWPVKKNIEEVINWVLQFDNDDFDLAFRVIKNLNVVGPENLNSALSIAYSKLMRHAKNKGINLSLKNTLYASIGGASKSGAMISYNFRLINELSSANFLDDNSIKYIEEGKIDNLVLVDDIIATGDQSSKDLREIADRVIPLGVKNIFVLTAIGFKTGIKKVQDTELADVFSALEYDEKDSIVSLDSKFYEGLSYSKRKAIFEKFSKYKGIGYDGVGALIAFYYNTPNCTINSIWTSAHGWIPLFPRMSDVSGIDKHYPELDSALQKPISTDVKQEKACAIFVEGKTHEIFFEELAKKFEQFGFEKLDVISIGPFYSERLIGSLDKLSEKYLLVTEIEVPETGHGKRVKEIVDANKLLTIENIMGYFDIEKIMESDYFSNAIDKEAFKADPKNSQDYLELRLIIKATPTRRDSNVRELVQNYLLDDKVKELIAKIKAFVK